MNHSFDAMWAKLNSNVFVVLITLEFASNCRVLRDKLDHIDKTKAFADMGMQRVETLGGMLIIHGEP
jgi:hypothetical protein